MIHSHQALKKNSLIKSAIEIVTVLKYCTFKSAVKIVTVLTVDYNEKKKKTALGSSMQFHDILHNLNHEFIVDEIAFEELCSTASKTS